MPEKEKQKVSDQIKNEFTKAHYYRDTKHAVLGGVIAGFANYTGWDVTLLRVLFVIIVIFTALFPCAIAYLVVWICAPDESSIPTKTKSAKTTKVTSVEADEDYHPTPKNPAPFILRATLMFLGIIGFCIFIPILIALIPLTIVSIIAITGATIIEPPLFIATAIMSGVLLFMVNSIGLQISTALVTAKLNKQAVIGLITSIIIVVVLSVASTTTGALWLCRVGKDGIETTFNSLSDDIYINVDHSSEDSHRVQVDVGPIHIRTH